MKPIVGVIGDEELDVPKLIVGYLISKDSVKTVGNDTFIYISEKKPYVTFEVMYGSIDTPGPLSGLMRGRVRLSGDKGPKYYYPTFDQPPVQKEPDNTFKKRCAGLIMKRAREFREIELTNKNAEGAVGRYSNAARNFMRKAEDLFELNGIP